MSATHSGAGVIGLLDIEPELGEHLSAEERRLVSQVAIPVRTVSSRDLDLDRLLDGADAFAAFILDGVMMHRVAIGEQAALRLLGPGDMVVHSGAIRTTLMSTLGHRVSGQLRLALLDNRFLLTVRRFPRLVVGLQVRLGEQHQRLAAQLAICQLPRVEDRLLAIMWLLAEMWGRVTPSGTVLPIALTHDALGELVGARRPTVSLALKELAERGALFRQAGEWLLIDPPVEAPRLPTLRTEPRLQMQELEDGKPQPERWGPEREQEQRRPTAQTESGFDRLAMIVEVLRDGHVQRASETRTRLEHARLARERTRSLREQINRQRLSRRRPDRAR